MKLRHGKGRKALSHGARSASKRNITNRFELVHCEACGRKVKRSLANSSIALIVVGSGARAKGACENHFWTGASPHPLFLSNKNNELQGLKSGSSIPLNILGGYRWPNADAIDRDLLRKIVRAEIGDPR